MLKSRVLDVAAGRQHTATSEDVRQLLSGDRAIKLHSETDGKNSLQTSVRLSPLRSFSRGSGHSPSRHIPWCYSFEGQPGPRDFGTNCATAPSPDASPASRAMLTFPTHCFRSVFHRRMSGWRSAKQIVRDEQAPLDADIRVRIRSGHYWIMTFFLLKSDRSKGTRHASQLTAEMRRPGIKCGWR